MAGEDGRLALRVEADDVVAVGRVGAFHAGRAHRHAGHGQAAQVRALGQDRNLLRRHMAFDELAVVHPGVALRQARRHAQALLDRAHVRLDVVIHGKAVVA